MKSCRLSKHASHQLTKGNPNIADLSDKNRPTKIGEKFSVVYDDQWSEAFEALKESGKTEQYIVEELAMLVQVFHVLRACLVLMVVVNELSCALLL
jgi:hypothetical protein